jgi:hypothetical protein
MTCISLEFKKLKHRHMLLILLALILTQALWFLFAMRNMNEAELSQGWLNSLYQFSLLNCIMMPLVSAVIASRISDIEHKGNTFKLLETLLPPSRLFLSKLICGSVFMIFFAAAQFILIITFGSYKGFHGNIPLAHYIFFLLCTALLNIILFLIQLALSLLFQNQMISLTIGLIGSFVGLMSLFFSNTFRRFIIWSYYGNLSTVNMDWNETTRVCTYSTISVPVSSIFYLLILFFVLLVIAQQLFIRKEY